MRDETDDRRRDAKRFWNLASLWRRVPKVGISPGTVVHREAKWTLVRYSRPPEAPVRFATPVLLVPSLINRPYVLDLAPQRSFVEYLVAQGHDVFLIDWGRPGPEDKELGFGDFCVRYIERAVRRAAALAGGDRVHVLGYCLGGTMAAIHASLEPRRVASLVALAAPIRFADAGILATWTRTPSFDLGAIARGFGNVPWPLMQAAFSMMRPTLNLKKTIDLVDRAWDEDFLDGFLATERWGADNVSFPGRAWAEYCQWLYRDDALIHDTLVIDGRAALLANITCPTLVVCFGHDTIVPAANARVLLERIGATDKELLEQPGGHVGAVVSRKAANGLWREVSRFLGARDAAAGGARPVRRAAQPSRAGSSRRRGGTRFTSGR